MTFLVLDCISMIRRMIGVFVIGLIWVAFPLGAFAIALPSAWDIHVTPGVKNSIEIPIENTAPTSSVASISLMSASFIDGSDQPVLERLDSDIASWLSLSRDSYNLIAGEKSSVTLSVLPPLDASAQVFSIAIVATQNLPGQISLSHGSATLVFITVGDEKPDGRCTSISATDPSAANISITNAGRGILVAGGQIVLRGPLGIRFAQTDMNPVRHRILSHQTRSWNVVLPSVPWWAFGSLSFDLENSNIQMNDCDSIPGESRWWPIVCTVMIAGIGSIMLFRAKRA